LVALFSENKIKNFIEKKSEHNKSSFFKIGK